MRTTAYVQVCTDICAVLFMEVCVREDTEVQVYMIMEEELSVCHL